MCGCVQGFLSACLFKEVLDEHLGMSRAQAGCGDTAVPVDVGAVPQEGAGYLQSCSLLQEGNPSHGSGRGVSPGQPCLAPLPGWPCKELGLCWALSPGELCQGSPGLWQAGKAAPAELPCLAGVPRRPLWHLAFGNGFMGVLLSLHHEHQ